MSELKGIELKLNALHAKAVAVAGSFNNWSPTRTPLRKTSNGHWEVKITLPPGHHEYRFVVDGRWLSDPNAKAKVSNPYGGSNSVLVI